MRSKALPCFALLDFAGCRDDTSENRDFQGLWELRASKSTQYDHV